jgi:hypothetical protein
MNKKRKILTLVALIAFSVIIALHYSALPDIFYNTRFHSRDMVIEDIRMPLFVLGVFYAGLFAILGDNKRKEQ